MDATMLSPTTIDVAPTLSCARILRAYAREATYEFLKALRLPAASIPFLLMPAPLYLFFGVFLTGTSPELRAHPELANVIFSGWCVFAIMMPALFGIGCGLAMERTAGLLKFKRAMPTPTGAYLTAKFFMAMAFAAIAMAELVVTALLVGKISLSGVHLAAFAATMVIGVIPFCALGLFVGAHTSASAAPAIANLIFLPMVWLSGFFFPLPPWLSRWSIIWPSFHLHIAASMAAGATKFDWTPFVVLAGVTILFGGLAMRRLARVG
jgi:ABC-2 type transport system permease protein